MNLRLPDLFQVAKCTLADKDCFPHMSKVAITAHVKVLLTRPIQKSNPVTLKRAAETVTFEDKTQIIQDFPDPLRT